MREKILAIIEKNSRIDLKDLAALLVRVKQPSRMRSRRWKRRTLSAVITR